MSLRDFSLFVLVCLIWGFNMIAAKVAVGYLHVPPLFFALLRSAVIAVAVAPWLLPMPRPRWRAFVVGVLMGGGGFGLMFIGLRTATPSASAVVSQLGVPMVTILSVVVLGERIRWRRLLGITLSVGGVLLVMFDPSGFEVSVGLIFAAGGAFCGALGTIMMKQMEGVRPLRLQAWVGLSSTIVLLPMTLVLEEGQIPAAIEAGLPFVGLVLFSGLVVSVFAHTIYYGFIQRYEANMLAPLTLMSPLMSIGLGIWLTHDPFDIRMAFGSAVALLGVLIIAVRRNVAMPESVVIRSAAR